MFYNSGELIAGCYCCPRPVKQTSVPLRGDGQQMDEL